MHTDEADLRRGQPVRQNFQNRGFGRELAGRPETGVSVLGNLETGVSVVRKSETGDSVSETGVSVDTWRVV